MNNYVTKKESILTIGVSNNNYLGVNYKPNKRLNLYTDHSFFIEKIKHQLFNFGVKYSIYRKTNFDLNIHNSLPLATLANYSSASAAVLTSGWRVLANFL